MTEDYFPKVGDRVPRPPSEAYIPQVGDRVRRPHWKPSSYIDVVFVGSRVMVAIDQEGGESIWMPKDVVWEKVNHECDTCGKESDELDADGMCPDCLIVINEEAYLEVLEEVRNYYNYITYLLDEFDLWSEDGVFCFPDGEVFRKQKRSKVLVNTEPIVWEPGDEPTKTVRLLDKLTGKTVECRMTMLSDGRVFVTGTDDSVSDSDITSTPVVKLDPGYMEMGG
jgi:hypothetical protein